jgi:hypothetical protein
VICDLDEERGFVSSLFLPFLVFEMFSEEASRTVVGRCGYDGIFLSWN